MAIAAAGFGGAVYFARGCERTPGTARPQGAPALAIAGTLGVDEHVRALGDLAGYRRHTVVTPRLPTGECVPRQIIHRDVKGLNFLLKEMSGYFETCICDFGAQSYSSSPRRWRFLGRACPAGVARVENLVDTVSKTGFKGTLAFMSPEQLEVDTCCWVPQQPLREPWRKRRMRRMSA